MRRKILKFLQNAGTKTAEVPAGERPYTIGDFDISLPNSHLLAMHQRDHPLYDRFLLSLGNLKLDGWIIDIGANVGDSAAALLSTSPKRLLCLEPADEFFPLLETNAALFRKAGSRVTCIKSAVGPGGQSARLNLNVSTASLTAGAPGLVLVSLDQLIALHCNDGARVQLIKCDVDGFDAMALGSGLDAISRDQPLLYFEAEITSQACLTQTIAFCQRLTDAGYRNWSLFDNFGLPLHEDVSVAAVSGALNYTWALYERRSTRTIYYFDVLCSTEQYRPHHLAALAHFKKRWLG